MGEVEGDKNTHGICPECFENVMQEANEVTAQQQQKIEIPNDLAGKQVKSILH